MEKRLAFNEIPIDRNEISQDELNIAEKKRSNLFAWNGQFSPQFIETLLSKYAEKDFFVVDPFLGSGTVLVECARKKMRAYGTELNVSAYSMAKIYELCNLLPQKRSLLLKETNQVIKNTINSTNSFGTLLKKNSTTKNTELKTILSLLVVLLDIYNNEISNDLVKNKFESLCKIIKDLPFTESQIRAENGDARNLNLEDECADLLLTSPPYINVFNYHQKYRASVEALGVNVLSLAKSEFGSNRKHRSNRLFTVIQYCVDIALSIKEASRVLKNKSRLIYVVGRESSVLGYSFCNSELVYNLATSIFGLKCMLRQERVFRNRYGQMIYEDILHFENNKNNALPDEKIVAQAQLTAVNMLKTKLKQDNKNKPLLEQAILNANNVKKSEVYYA